jgi:DNA polymerase III gamma/tau subunit
LKLYNKYRPKSFDEMVGDYSFIDNMLTKKKSNAFIFKGNAGTGKSTSGRIVAKQVGADDLDIMEINCGADTSIDNIRAIIEQTRTVPFGKAWVVILDEAHALSKPAQEALKIPMENSNDKVYYILCTTHPEKILKPIRTRCTEVHFKDLKVEELDKLVRKIISQEGLDISTEIMDTIADTAGGSARKALVLIDAVSSMNEDEAMDYLLGQGGDSEAPELIELARAIYGDADWTTIARILKGLDGFNPESIRIMLMNYGKAMLLNNKGSGSRMGFFLKPTYDNGIADVVWACYEASNKRR